MNKKYFQKFTTTFMIIILLTGLSVFKIKTQEIEIVNQDIFTSIPGLGLTKRITVGNTANGMMIAYAINIRDKVYIYEPSNSIKTSNWTSIPLRVEVVQIAVGEDGTLGGIDEAGKIYVLENNSWKPTKSGKAKYLDVVNKNLMVCVGPDGKIYVSKDGGDGWAELPGRIKDFVNVSASGDKTIIGCTKNFEAYYFDGKEWLKMSDETQSLKKVSVGSSTQIYGINKNDELVKFNASSRKWEISKNLLFSKETKNRHVKVEDVSVNKDGNVFCISGDNPGKYAAKMLIFSNIIINFTEQQKQLMPGSTITLNNLDKLLVLREENYLKAEEADPDDPKARFEIIRSAQFVGFSAPAARNRTLQSDPKEGWKDYEGPAKCTSFNFLSPERWLIKGEPDNTILKNFATKKNLSVFNLEEVVKEYKEKTLKQLKNKYSAEISAASAAAGIGAAATIGFFGLAGIPGAAAASALGIKWAVEKKKVEKETTLSEHQKGMVVFAYTGQQTLSEIFKINIIKQKPKVILTTENNQFNEDDKFDSPGHGHIQFKAKGTGNLRLWLWDKDKKLKRLITIGGWGNKKVSLGTKKGWEHFVEEDEIFKSNLFTSFYISIKDNKLEFGKGNLIGQDVLGASKEDPELKDVVYFTFSRLPEAEVELQEVAGYTWLLGEKMPAKKPPAKPMKKTVSKKSTVPKSKTIK